MREGRVDSLSHALLARWRLNDGCPGGTDCELADGLDAVSMSSALRRATGTYGVPMLGCAANGGGAVGAELAINECSPDMLSLACRARVVECCSCDLSARGRDACGTHSMALGTYMR